MRNKVRGIPFSLPSLQKNYRTLDNGVSFKEYPGIMLLRLAKEQS